MLKVTAKIRAKDKKAMEDIRFVVRAMVSSIPLKIGDYWMYGAVPVEFEVNEK